MTEADALAAVQTFAATLSLPQLSAAELQSAAFEHYDATTKGAKAQDIAKVLEGNAQQDWIERREVDYLRAGIAAANPELVRLMQESTSPIVKSAIIETIYNAIAKTYSGLTQVALAICARKKEESGVTQLSSLPPHKGVEVDLKIKDQAKSEMAESPEFHEELPAASAEDELRRIINLQFLAVCLLNEFLVPACEKRGVPLSPELQSTLLTNMLNQAYCNGVHKKVPLELLKGLK